MKLLKRKIFLIIFFLSLYAQAIKPYIPGQISITPGNYYSVYIMDQGRSDTDDLASMLRFYNPKISEEYAEEIAKIYVEECSDEGVNYDIAFCQMVLETGFLSFGGSVLSKQYNFCGLGAVSGHSRGEYFPDMRTGIRAHIQHLKAYASRENIRKKSVDRRFRFVKRGSATTIYALQGKWATDPQYDIKLERLLERLFTFRQFANNVNAVADIK